MLEYRYKINTEKLLQVKRVTSMRQRMHEPQVGYKTVQPTMTVSEQKVADGKENNADSCALARDCCCIVQQVVAKCFGQKCIWEFNMKRRGACVGSKKVESKRCQTALRDMQVAKNAW